MEIILLLSLNAFFLTVFVAVIRFTASEELDRWIGEEAEDREELPKVTFKQIKSFVLLEKVEECRKINSYSCYRTIFLCNGEKFTFTNLYELKKYNDCQKNIEKEKKAMRQRLVQAEFLKHLQKIVNVEYDKIIEEVKDKK